MRFRLWLAIIAVLAMIVPANAQTDFSLNTDVQLDPFVSPVFGIQGLYPSEWTSNPSAPGIYLRQRDALDNTALIVQAANLSADDFLGRLQEQFSLPEAPEVVRTVETDFFTWNIYRLQRTQGNATLEIDVALGTQDELTALVMLQTSEIFYEGLNANVFQPIVLSLTPIQLYEDPDERYSIVIPTGWTATQEDEYGVLTNPTGTINLYLTAVETDDESAALVDFWQTVDPDFAAEFVEEDDVIVREGVAGLDYVTLINFVNEDDLFEVRQGVARVYNETAYLTLLVGDSFELEQNNAALGLIDENFVITEITDDEEAADEDANSG